MLSYCKARWNASAVSTFTVQVSHLASGHKTGSWAAVLFFCASRATGCCSGNWPMFAQMATIRTNRFGTFQAVVGQLLQYCID